MGSKEGEATAEGRRGQSTAVGRQDVCVGLPPPVGGEESQVPAVPGAASRVVGVSGGSGGNTT